MNYDSIFEYMPEATPWIEKRTPRIDEIEVWEVISEVSNGAGFVGVYAAWQPHAELYVVTHKWRIVEEFSGWNANKRLEAFLIANQIPYPQGPDEPIVEFSPSMIVL